MSGRTSPEQRLLEAIFDIEARERRTHWEKDFGSAQPDPDKRSVRPPVTLDVRPAGLVIHNPVLCKGTFCPFHNPSPHHMVNWPIFVRVDKDYLTERLCPHGIGHPDPDSVAFFIRSWGEQDGGAMGIHGCDRCCSDTHVDRFDA